MYMKQKNFIFCNIDYPVLVRAETLGALYGLARDFLSRIAVFDRKKFLVKLQA